MMAAAGIASDTTSYPIRYHYVVVSGRAKIWTGTMQYSDSPVADYAWLAFGNNLSRSFRNYAAGKIRQADCKPAVIFFREFDPTDCRCCCRSSTAWMRPAVSSRCLSPLRLVIR